MTPSELTKSGTRAHTPDLDWSQVRETVLMLELGAVQIESAMRDSGTSVDVLTDSFTSMAGYMRLISDAVHALPNNEETKATKEQLVGSTEHVSSMMHQAIIAFQFYDKLVQRLTHVCHGMGMLSSLVADKSRLYNPGEWVSLQNEIRSKYSTREELAMFEAVMSGVPVNEAVEQFMHEMKDKGDEIELF